MLQPLAVMELDALLMPNVLPVPPTVAPEDLFSLGSDLGEPVPKYKMISIYSIIETNMTTFFCN